jgi:hypothetical protein
LPWILAGGGVVVVAVVVVLIIVLSGGSDTSSPEGVAKSAVDAVNNQDYEAVAKITCGGSASGKDVANVSKMGLPDGVTASFELGAVKKDSDNAASAEVTIKLGGNLPPEAQGMSQISATLKMKNENGSWCIDKLQPNL